MNVLFDLQYIDYIHCVRLQLKRHNQTLQGLSVTHICIATPATKSLYENTRWGTFTPMLPPVALDGVFCCCCSPPCRLQHDAAVMVGNSHLR